jgi:hypothetical protein
MIKTEEKHAALKVVNEACKRVIAEQNILCNKIEQLIALPQTPSITKNDSSSQLAEELEFAMIVSSEWPEELDQIQDAVFRGAVGVYHAAVNRLKTMRAAYEFLVLLHD